MLDPGESLGDSVDVRVRGGGAGAGADLLVGAAVTRRGFARLLCAYTGTLIRHILIHRHDVYFCL